MSAYAYYLLAVSLLVMWLMMTGLLLLHEYGHAIAMRKLGLRDDKIVLGVFRIFSVKLFGVQHDFCLLPLIGYCISQDYAKADSNRRAWVALAGPVISAAGGLVFLGLNAIHPAWALSLLAQGSFILALMNSIPLPPFDGWTVAEHFLIKRGVRLSTLQRKQILAIGVGAIVMITLMM